MDTNTREHLKTVIVGHVDHGKSTIIGRLLADTGSLPEGKLQQIQESCRKNSRPFEYAFLLDALKNEQSQGITIDMARCFFKTKKRNYIIIDAPGHIEFLKNMITGAARADSALLVIDAHEGIQENSKRHGYMLSMLGVEQIAVLINKFDLVDYDREIYDKIVEEYNVFLSTIGVQAVSYIPVSGRNGDNIATKSHSKIPWYNGPTVLEQLDNFDKLKESLDKPFRMPVQDVYKFTANNDDRRIVAGTIESGTISSGDNVIFYPSGKKSTVKSIEGFNITNYATANAPHASGLTLTTQIYIQPGELIAKENDPPPLVGSRFRVNMFWLALSPMITNKRYKLKLASSRVVAELVDVINVIDASELSSEQDKKQLERHDIGECIIETAKPIAFDPVQDFEGTGRFVIVDNHEIAGGGVITAQEHSETSLLTEYVEKREYSWEQGSILNSDRAARNHHKGKFIVFTGERGSGKRSIAKHLESRLFNMRLNSYYLGISSIFEGIDYDSDNAFFNRDEHIKRLGELARIMTDAGLIFITAIDNIDDYELEKLKLLNYPNELLVIHLGNDSFGEYSIDLNLKPNSDIKVAVQETMKVMNHYNVIPEYCI